MGRDARAMHLREERPHDLLLRGDVLLRAESINEESRTVDAVLATESRATVFDLRQWRQVEEILVMEGCELPAQMPLFDSHPQKRRDVTTEDMRGSIRNLRVERRQLVGTLYFADDEQSERLWQLVRGGHVTDMSTGNVPLELVEIPPGQTEVVGGKKYKAGPELPLLVTVRWRPREGSACPWGADPKSKIRTEGPPPHIPETLPVPADLRAYLESIGLKKDATEAEAWAFHGTLRGEQLAQAETLRGNVTPPAPTPTPTLNPVPAPAPTPTTARVPAPTDGETVRAEAAAAERARILRIEELAGADVPREVVRQAIHENWDESRVSREFLTIVRGARHAPVNGAPAVHVRGHEADCTLPALEAACLLRAGLNPIENLVRYEEGCMVRQLTEANRAALEQAADRAWRYRDLSLMDLCREAIRLDQRTCPHTRGETIRTAVSGASLTNIFTTTVGAQLIASYEASPDTTGGWVRETEVPNFQTNERTQLGKSGAMKRLPRGKKADHVTRGDKKEEYKIARYANQFVVDEQDIIDDAFSALLDMPMEMGESARQVRPDLVYAILLANAALGADNTALFHADHANLRTGAALAAATLKTAITDMGVQQQDGRNLSIVPAFLLVPRALKHTASELISSSEIRDTTASTVRGTRNALQDDNLGLTSDSRLDNGVTDPATEDVHSGSNSTWFLVASAGRHTVEVGYLRGTGRAPQLRSFVLTQGQWGIGWDINFDIGAKALDFRGLHKNTA